MTLTIFTICITPKNIVKTKSLSPSIHIILLRNFCIRKTTCLLIAEIDTGTTHNVPIIYCINL